MKKLISLVLSTFFLFAALIGSASAYEIVYNNGPLNAHYSRYAARDYMNAYTTSPNSAYAYYSGGDCTNFVSQALKSGGMSMTSKKSVSTTADWYYYVPNIPARTATWTGAEEFRSYWGVINGVGQKKARAMTKYTAAELKNNSSSYKSLVASLELGDVIVFADASGHTYHSMGVQRTYYEGNEKK